MNPTKADKPFLRKHKDLKRNLENAIKIYQLFMLLTELYSVTKNLCHRKCNMILLHRKYYSMFKYVTFL